MKYLHLYILLLFCSACTDKKSPSLHIRTDENAVTVSNDSREILQYQSAVKSPDFDAPDHYQRSGFIYPLYTPSGQIITDDFPRGHTHQHSIFMAWVNTTFRGEKVDFWNQHKLTGDVKHIQVIDSLITEDYVQFHTKLQQVSKKHGPVLDEIWTVKVYANDQVNVWDLHSVQKNITTDTLFLNEHVYGGLGVRLSKYWNPVDSLHFQDSIRVMTSEGISNRVKANHTRTEWIAVYGLIHGKMAGIAVMGHPDNYRFPQPVRVHPEMPYFSVSPVVKHHFDIAPQMEYNSRYRFITYDGVPPMELILEEWEKFKRL